MTLIDEPKCRVEALKEDKENPHKPLADVVIGRMKRMTQEERNQFIGYLAEEFCLRCGSEKVGGGTCWSCYDSYPDS
jgi:hypothetical protein